MKRFRVAGLLVGMTLAAVAMVACGSSSSNPTTINGVWNATLTEANNQSYGSLGLSLVVNNDGTLSVTNLTITSPSPCFGSANTASGSFTVSGNLNGNTSGSLSLTVTSGSPAGNTLKLSGMETGNTISGTWTLGGTYPGCSGNGTFTMTRA